MRSPEETHAYAAFQAGNLQESRSLFLNLSKTRGNDPQIWHMLGAISGMLGLIEEAEAACRKVIALAPTAREGYINLSNALSTQGKHDEALSTLERAIELGPPDAALTEHYAWSLHRLGAHSDAIQHFRRALALDPQRVTAHCGLGMALLATNNVQAAQEAFSIGQRIDTKHPDPHIGLGYVSRMQQDHSAACDHFKHALDLSPGNASIAYELALSLSHAGQIAAALNIGKSLHQAQPNNPDILLLVADLLSGMGRHDDALALLQPAARQHPSHVDIHMRLGECAYSLGEFDAAEEAFRRVVQLDPGHARAYNNLGLTLQQSGDLDTASDCYKKAIELDRDLPQAHHNLGYLLTARNRYAEAIKHYEDALRAKPQHIDALAGIATALERMGNTEQAYDRIRHLIEAGDSSPQLAIAFSALANDSDRAKRAIDMLITSINAPNLTYKEKVDSHFALGKLYDQLGEYDSAFYHYKRANKLKPRLFDRQQHIQTTNELIRCFSGDALASAATSDISTELPIFIVGMSRSGTSLVEQILSAHPMVYGAGELETLPRLAANLRASVNPGIPFPQCAGSLNTADLNAIARAYLDQFSMVDQDQHIRITDKLPSNYAMIGLIEMMLPKARIIHCRRDPIDTCLSCYFQNFVRGHHYTNELEDLSVYYTQYQKIMSHWQQTSRANILHVNYEDLVADPETLIRSIVAFCGLDWDDSCLDYHKSGRVCTTASYQQVRKPIYKRSVRKWEKYKAHLSVLTETLQSQPI